MRLIERNLKDYLYESRNNEDFSIGEMVDDIIEIFAEHNNWIPVSERLPDDGQLVVASNINGYMHIYVVGNIGWCVDIENKEILAWMPLPQPYKESDNK